MCDEHTFLKEKELYYKQLKDDVYIDPEYKSRVVKCKVCNNDFHFINNKKEFIQFIQNNINDDNDFAIEMIKLRSTFDYPGADSVHFDSKNNVCNYCKFHNPKSLSKKIKDYFTK